METHRDKTSMHSSCCQVLSGGDVLLKETFIRAECVQTIVQAMNARPIHADLDMLTSLEIHVQQSFWF
jgi:hypothetical protein